MYLNEHEDAKQTKQRVEPDAVKDHLPKHAQEIFLAAFNNAEEQYSEEEQAFRVAWSAVKRDYEKGDDGNWHRKDDS